MGQLQDGAGDSSAGANMSLEKPDGAPDPRPLALWAAGFFCFFCLANYVDSVAGWLAHCSLCIHPPFLYPPCSTSWLSPAPHSRPKISGASCTVAATPLPTKPTPSDVLRRVGVIAGAPNVVCPSEGRREDLAVDMAELLPDSWRWEEAQNQGSGTRPPPRRPPITEIAVWVECYALMAG